VFLLDEAKRALHDEEFYRRRWRKRALQISIVVLIVLAIASYFGIKQLNAIRAYKIGLQLMDEAQWEDAIVSFTKALSIRSEYPDASFKKAEALVTIGRYTEAKQTLLDTNPDSINNKTLAANIYNLLGIISLRQGSLDEAVSYFNTAIDLNPTASSSASSYLGLAEALVRQEKDLDKAVEYVNSAIALRPSPSMYTSLYNMQGRAYLAAGNYEAANQAFFESLSYNDNYVLSYYYLGVSFEATGNIAKAKGAYKRAVELNPDYDAAYDALQKLDAEYPDVAPESVR
jgi:tetratricopeptide (TPR) repeat protein